MSAKTTTEWVCERCGRTEHVKNTGQPKKWISVYFGNPPQHAEHQWIGHLCDPCGGRLVSFVQGCDKEEAAKDREVAEILERLNTP